MAKAKVKSKRRGKRKKTLAQQADRHDLYQKSVQSPEVEIEFFQERFQELRGREPLSLREDFSGTAYLCTEWCKSHPKRTAIGVDLCADTLDWGLRNNIEPAGEDVARRITLLNEDVQTVKTKRCDIVCAMNFSYCLFESRDLMRNYFKNVRRGLKKDGLFFLDLLGGTATYDVSEEEREIDGEDFTYIWEQATFNPIDHHMQCYIHFAFPDGSRLDRAFEYAWRLWTIPEIKELLLEAGFSKVHVYWEEFEEDEDDPDSDYLVGTGVYQEVTEVEQQESWLCYFVVEA